LHPSGGKVVASASSNRRPTHAFNQLGHFTARRVLQQPKPHQVTAAGIAGTITVVANGSDLGRLDDRGATRHNLDHRFRARVEHLLKSNADAAFADINKRAPSAKRTALVIRDGFHQSIKLYGVAFVFAAIALC
ncbi:MAG: hypothetical protein AAF297_07040, partial [Planctomycetota bacterium]